MMQCVRELWLRLISRDDPQSPIHRQNVAATCGHCHADAGRIAPYGLSLGVGDVSKVCMHCHRQTREFFRQSPHFKTIAA